MDIHSLFRLLFRVLSSIGGKRQVHSFVAMWQICTRRVSGTHGNGRTPEDSHYAVVEQLSTRRLFYTPAGKREPLYPPSPPRRSSCSQLLAQSSEDGNPMSLLMRIFIGSLKGKKKILVRSKTIWI